MNFFLEILEIIFKFFSYDTCLINCMEIKHSKRKHYFSLGFDRFAGDEFLIGAVLSFSWALSVASTSVGKSWVMIVGGAENRGSDMSGRCAVNPLIVGQAAECTR